MFAFSTQNYVCVFHVPFTRPALSQTGIYSSDLWFSILKVSSGAGFYIRQSLKYFPQRFPTLTCKELSSLACCELSAFLKMPEEQYEILQISVWDCFSISHSPCLTNARGVLRQVNASLFKQNEGLTYFFGVLLPFFVLRLSLPPRGKAFRMDLVWPGFPRIEFVDSDNL